MWPRGTSFPELPSAVISFVDFPLGSPSLLMVPPHCSFRYVLRFLQKGIPSLFSDLKSLYVNPAKVEILHAMFESAADSLKKASKLPFSCAKVGPSQRTVSETKTKQ
jgi:hypothetical protein